MPSSEAGRLYNLASFADAWLLPASADSARPGGRTVWAHGLTIEAFLWLDLGAKSGAFPAQESARLAMHVAPAVQSAIRALGDLTGLISPPHLDLAVRSVETDTYLARDTMGYAGEEGLATPFETGLMMAMYAARHPHAGNLFMNVNLDQSDRWDRMTGDPIERGMLEAVAQGIDGVSLSTGALLVSQFITCLGPWIEADRFLSALAADERYDAAARLGLAGDMAAIQSWRMNFGVPAVRQRLQIAMTKALMFLVESDDRMAAEIFRGDDPRNELVALMDRWQERIQAVYQGATATT